MSGESLRVDQWLWRARLFKTRGAAGDAVSGGLVHVNGQRVRPARKVVVGDVLEVTKGREFYRLTVSGIPSRRGPAPEAREFYSEDDQVRVAREHLRQQRAETRRLNAQGDPGGRPDKHSRKTMRDLRGKSG